VRRVWGRSPRGTGRPKVEREGGVGRVPLAPSPPASAKRDVHHMPFQPGDPIKSNDVGNTASMAGRYGWTTPPEGF
jgi:hypothetical protein